jgi:hypothetical protein
MLLYVIDLTPLLQKNCDLASESGILFFFPFSGLVISRFYIS